MNAEKNEFPLKIYQRLIDFKKECPKLELNKVAKVRMKNGETYQFKYCDLAGISIIDERLSNSGLGYLHKIDNDVLTTIIFSTEGETIDSSINISRFLSQNEHDIQIFGKVLTYLRRYSLTAILGLSADDDDDANSVVGNSYDIKSIEQKPWLNEFTNDFKEVWFRINREKIDINEAVNGFRISKKNRDLLLDRAYMIQNYNKYTLLDVDKYFLKNTSIK